MSPAPSGSSSVTVSPFWVTVTAVDVDWSPAASMLASAALSVWTTRMPTLDALLPSAQLTVMPLFSVPDPLLSSE